MHIINIDSYAYNPIIAPYILSIVVITSSTLLVVVVNFIIVNITHTVCSCVV